MPNKCAVTATEVAADLSNKKCWLILYPLDTYYKQPVHILLGLPVEHNSIKHKELPQATGPASILRTGISCGNTEG